MSAGSGPIAHREAGQSDPFLRRELRGPVLVLARGLGLVFTVLTLVMYARWLDLGLAVARQDAWLPGGSSFYPEIVIAAAVAAIVSLAGSTRTRCPISWRPPGRGERRGEDWRAAERIRKLHGVAMF